MTGSAAKRPHSSTAWSGAPWPSHHQDIAKLDTILCSLFTGYLINDPPPRNLIYSV